MSGAKRRSRGSPVAAPCRHGEAGRHAEGRRQPPGAVARGCRGAQPARVVGKGARLCDLHRRHRQSLRAPRGQRCRGAAGDERLAHGQPADRRPLRRHVRRAGGLRGAGGAGGCRHQDQAAGDRRRLDQRGRLALPARRHGLGGVRRPQQARRHAGGQGLEGRRAEGRAGRDAEGRAGADARGHAGLRRSTAMSRPISSRARGWRTRARPSAWSPASRAAGATSSRSTGEEAHAGTTPRAARKDAFAAATRIAAAMYEATTDADDTLRFTIGRVEVYPGSPNTVPGKASFTIDMRHPAGRRAGGARAEAAGHRGRRVPRPAPRGSTA